MRSHSNAPWPVCRRPDCGKPVQKRHHTYCGRPCYWESKKGERFDEGTAKRCSRCRKIKPLAEFHPLNGKPRPACKDCSAKADRSAYERAHPGARRHLEIRLTLVCAYCDRKFERLAGDTNLKGRQYCDRICKAADKNIIEPCAICGTPTKRYKANHKDGDRVFCTPEHFREGRTGPNSPRWHGGGEIYRGPDWKVQRRLALKRDAFTCQTCGITQDDLGESLDVHHIIPFRIFGDSRYLEANELGNLISLCTPCHAKAEPRE